MKIKKRSNCCKAATNFIQSIKYVDGKSVTELEYIYCTKCNKKLDQYGNYIKPIEYHKEVANAKPL